MISLKHINIAFDRVVFDDASVIFCSGHVNYLIGESGSGKTTLLNQLGLLSQSHCEYFFDDIQVNQLSIEEKAKEGFSYCGFVPVEQRGTGEATIIDLIFEKDE